LIEVIVALVALSLALAVVYESMGHGLRRSEVYRQRETAWLVAKSLLTEIRRLPNLQAGIREGTTDGGARWRYEIRAAQGSAASDIAVFEVTIAVTWGPRSAQQIQLKSIEIPGILP
jgi:type II secretory pathway pseudopilin PulG